MPKPGGSGGGGSGGITAWRGTKGADTFTVTGVDQLKTTIIDGRGGTDTLDLAGLTGGISLSMSGGVTSRLSVDQGFFGVWWSIEAVATLPNLLVDTIKSMETIKGGSGNDRLQIVGGGTAVVDGGAGDDAIEVVRPGSDLLVGGSGSDWIRGYADDILVGGTWTNSSVLPAGDGEADTYINAGIILDFEIGIDRLILEASGAQALATLWEAATWTDSTGQVHEGARLIVDGTTSFTLVGITPAEGEALVMPTVSFTVIAPGGGNVQGAAGHDDFLLPTNDPDTFVLTLDGGNDTIVYPVGRAATYTYADDAIDLPDGVAPSDVVWEPVLVNGQEGLLYDYGSGSVTVLGLTFDQLSSMDYF